ncbi:purine and uridine phosphorylase [Aspergillus sclerotioniger CBS 115572]|uniref:Purine and uridine phosphorylase n=1 Tax=Aspergillus sclerotioniger CBS 115572 TaxID=1450535 RepID=A0A317WVF4_9EURO|nr:purine and uridine phosphorylase [Aspergillus sclerotioniger CBS 115572]PWY90333.1 purine and uridine phosphorylase [Aspergillus sclerotioniger CBS 115572]
MSDPRLYTIGYICPTFTDFTAAQISLDEEHGLLKSPSHDDHNAYTIGRIGKHNVALTFVTGSRTPSTTTVATAMRITFPNLRIIFLVGAASGVPSPQHDIRLGDVVVGVDGENQTAVQIYYVWLPKGGAFLNQGPRFIDQLSSLREALDRLRRRHDMRSLEKVVTEMVEKNVGPDAKERFMRPPSHTDRLYRSDICHVGTDCIGCDPSGLIVRHNRPNSAVHYVVIGSGDYRIQHAVDRDCIVRGTDVLCLDNEAVGLVDAFPCLVVRGISNYADVHASDRWEMYAALMAAAYMRGLLEEID